MQLIKESSKTFLCGYVRNTLGLVGFIFPPSLEKLFRIPHVPAFSDDVLNKSAEGFGIVTIRKMLMKVIIQCKYQKCLGGLALPYAVPQILGVIKDPQK